MPRKHQQIFCVAAGCRARNRHRSNCIEPGCSGCAPRRARHPSHLCIKHEHDMKQDIQSLPQLYRDLATALVPPNMGLQPKVSGSNFKANSFPFNDAAAELRKQTQRHLAQLTTIISKQRSVTAPQLDPNNISENNIAILSKFLWTHLEAIVSSPTLARRTCGTLNRIHRNGRRIAHPTGTRVVDVGPCTYSVILDVSTMDQAEPQQLTSACPGTIRARLRPSDSLLPSELVCSHTPDHTWPAHQWLRLRKQLQRTGNG